MELEVIQNKIFEIRGCKVMLDFDLALLYNVENKRLKSPPPALPKGEGEGSQGNFYNQTICYKLYRITKQNYRN